MKVPHFLSKALTNFCITSRDKETHQFINSAFKILYQRVSSGNSMGEGEWMEASSPCLRGTQTVVQKPVSCLVLCRSAQDERLPQATSSCFLYYSMEEQSKSCGIFKGARKKVKAFQENNRVDFMQLTKKAGKRSSLLK